MGMVIIPVIIIWFFLTKYLARVLAKYLEERWFEIWAARMGKWWIRAVHVTLFLLPVADSIYLTMIQPVACLMSGVVKEEVVRVDGYETNNPYSLRRLSDEGFTYIDVPLKSKYGVRDDNTRRTKSIEAIYGEGLFRASLVDKNNSECAFYNALVEADKRRVSSISYRSGKPKKRWSGGGVWHKLSENMPQGKCLALRKLDDERSDIYTNYTSNREGNAFRFLGVFNISEYRVSNRKTGETLTLKKRISIKRGMLSLGPVKADSCPSTPLSKKNIEYTTILPR